MRARQNSRVSLTPGAPTRQRVPPNRAAAPIHLCHRVQIALHVKHYNAPELQRHVVRIICMVPIYALVSWLSLRFSSARRWLSPLRECYEAVVLYSFLQYLIGCLQRKSGDYAAWLAALPPQEPMWPLHGALGRAVGVHTIDHGADFMKAMQKARSLTLP